MKNFRKVLALILVVATLFSFVAMASAKTADEYTDYADVKYVEAVDVLTAIGVINGYDGAFHPADTIDRDEMAKMIAVLRNAGDFDADLFASANKFADVKGQWAEGYIAYCAQLGIIAGRNATTFDPDAAVKVVEVAKQLLCVLGFDAQKQGYVGANWEVNVIRDAAKYGIIPADVSPYAAATRDQAAQMFLNALKAPIVAGYLSENVVYITNSLYVTDGDAVNNSDDDDLVLDKISLKEAEVAGWEVAYGNAVVSNTALWEIYEGVLELSTTVKYDCFGRPGHEWYLVAANGKKTTIGFYADTPVWTTTAPTTANVTAALKAADDDYATTKAVYAVRNGAQANAAYGNGIETELYVLASGNLLLVQIDTFVGKVGTVNSYRGTFTIIDNAKNVDYTFAIGNYELEADDIVLYQLCNGSIEGTAANKDAASGKILHNVTVIEPTLAAVSDGDVYCENYRTENAELRMLNCFTAEGKTYYYSENYAKSLEVGNWPFIDADDIVAADGHKWNIYVDQNGYVVYAKADVFTPAYEYAYLVEKTATKANESWTVGIESWDYTADLVKYAADGKLTATEDVAISAALYNDATDAYDNNIYVGAQKKGNVGSLIKYHLDEDGKFVYDGEGKFAAVGTKVSNTEYVLGTSSSGDKIVATSKTVFMVRTLTSEGYVYNQYTGFAALPGEYTAKDVSLSGATRTNIQYFYDNTAVAGDASGYRFATYVFIDAMYQKSADHFFTLGTLHYHRFETALIETGLFPADYWVFDGFVNGERAVIASDTMLVKGEFYNATATYLFDVTIGGKQYPLYAHVGAPAQPNATINFNYIVGEDEVYVGMVDLTVTPSKEILPTLAKDAKIYILGGKANAAGDRVLTVKTALGEYADFVAEGAKTGYVVLNTAKTQVLELYIIDASYYADGGIDIWN